MFLLRRLHVGFARFLAETILIDALFERFEDRDIFGVVAGAQCQHAGAHQSQFQGPGPFHEINFSQFSNAGSLGNVGRQATKNCEFALKMAGGERYTALSKMGRRKTLVPAKVL